MQTTNFYTIGLIYPLSNIYILPDDLINTNLCDFLRGFYESNSTIYMPDSNNDIILEIKIKKMCEIEIINLIKKLNILYTYKKINTSNNDIYSYTGIITISSINVLDFLSKLYYPNVNMTNVNEKFYNEYENISNYQSIKYNKHSQSLQFKIPKCQFILNDINSIPPKKAHASDAGFDLTIIKVSKNISECITMYDTGIIAIPEFGYYFEVYARSSLSKTGYILANSVGIIDASYRGTIKIVLIKIDKNMPDIALPFKGMQLLLRQSIHYELNESNIENINNTMRGDGGFGSTNA